MKKKNDEVIRFRVSVRGDRNLWWDFVTEVRNQKKKNKDITIWKVLSGLIQEYLSKKDL